MTTTDITHTSQLSARTPADIRALLDAAFEGDFGDHDWEHALGGLHAVRRAGGVLVAHGAVVQRRLLHGGRALRTGYVEAVAVHPDHRRRGHGTAVMAALGDVVRRAYDLGALGATTAAMPLYARLGWQRWEGVTSVLSPDGLRRTPQDDGAVFVLPAGADLDLRGELTCDWRDGDVW